MTLEPAQFATETQLWNAIVRQFGQPLPLPTGQVVLAEGAPPNGKGAGFQIGLGPGLGLVLVLEEFPFARLSGVEITLDEVKALPPALSEGLLMAAVDAVRTALPPGLAGLLAVQTAQPDLDAPECWLSVELDLGSGALARGFVGGKRRSFVQVLALIFPGAGGQSRGLPAGLLQDLTVEVALAAGETRLTVGRVRSLEPGDVLLTAIRADQRSFVIGDREVVIGTGTMLDSEAAPAPGWTVKEILMTADTPDVEAPVLSLDDVPLTLRFVTEDRRIALSDLQDLVPGALLPVEVSALQAGLSVRIQANGVTIGDGHLVQIDDQFAVRVGRIAPKAS